MIQDTSLEAWRFMKDKLGYAQKQVFAAISQYPNSTNAELAGILDWPVNRITPRVGELRKKTKERPIANNPAVFSAKSFFKGSSIRDSRSQPEGSVRKLRAKFASGMQMGFASLCFRHTSSFLLSVLRGDLFICKLAAQPIASLQLFWLRHEQHGAVISVHIPN